MDDGYGSLRILFYAVSILLLAALYGFGAAIQQMNEGDLEKRKEDGDKEAERLLKVMEKPLLFINTVVFATGFFCMVCGVFLLPWMKDELTLAFGIIEEPILLTVCLYGLGAVFLLWPMLLLGVLLPKKLARRHPEAMTVWLSVPVRAVCTLFLPFVGLITVLVEGLLRLFGWKQGQLGDNVTEEEIMSMVNEGHEQGVIEAGEAEMITNIFEYGEKEAEDIMIHRTSIVALSGDLTLKEALDQMLEAHNSRFPVYGEDIDDILGIVHIRDVLACMRRCPGDKPIREVEGLLREPLCIPEVRNIDQLFSEMQSTKNHMVIVVDEYGQTAGLITMEDILEEIVGNIWDEYDDEEQLIMKSGDGSYTMSGMAPLEDVAEALGISFEEEEEEDIDTVNGFLISRLDRIPKEEEKPVIIYCGYRFQVDKMDNNRIRSVFVRKCEGDEECQQS